MMNQHIRDITDISDPFKFNYIRNIINNEKTNESNSNTFCVVMASPGFLLNGVSRNIFEMWCENEKNGLIIAGYTVEGRKMYI
jgi:cleavage and polyadenylation specificity factor subunit 3